MTGFRLPVQRIRKRLAKLNVSVNAEAFRPEVRKFASSTLSACVTDTPARDPGIIAEAQGKQYLNRINYIPSVHELRNPTLIVKGDDHWLFCDGKWRNASNGHKMSQRQWSAYQELLAERQRRIQRISAPAFIADRVQANQLYKRSWYESGASVGIGVPVSSEVISAHTRRRPKKNPQKGRAQWLGGKNVISLVILNLFLEIFSRYKDFSGKAILARAASRFRKRFRMDVENKVKRLIREAARA